MPAKLIYTDLNEIPESARTRAGVRMINANRPHRDFQNGKPVTHVSINGFAPKMGLPKE